LIDESLVAVRETKVSRKYEVQSGVYEWLVSKSAASSLKCGHPPPLPVVVQPESWYSFYRSTKAEDRVVLGTL